jgi:L-fuculose-phosphate aldolase
MDRFLESRREVFREARRMWNLGLVVASAGNISARVDDKLIAITPTAIPYDSMTEEQIVIVDVASGKAIESTRPPSYELPMHLAVYRDRRDVAGVVHTHAPFVTTLSVLRKPLPPVIDEMMLYFGGTIEVAEYAFTGTPDVGRNLLRALGDRTGAMLANHGNVCIGKTLGHAMHVAVAMEAAARVYVQALTIGEPVTLPRSAVTAGRKMFEDRK